MDKDTHLIFESYQLNGKAKNQTLEDLAQKHKADINKLKAQLDKGIKTEHEHTKDEQTAKKIAMDHLTEDPEYYDKLSKIEKEEDAEMPYPEFAKLAKHSTSKLPEDQELSYTHEKIAAALPQDIRPGKDGEDEILDKAAPILAKLVFNGDEKKAARMMFYDEDFNSDLVSTYRHFQEHGFPGKENNIEDYREQMPDSREEYVSDEDELSPADKKRLASNEFDWVNMFYRTFGPGRREEMIKNNIDPYEFFVDYYTWMRNSSPEVITKFANLYNSKYPDHKVDIEKLLSMFDEIKDKPMTGYKAPGKGSEEEERRLDPKCWKGYHKQGTKLKGGVRVNNCVKNS